MALIKTHEAYMKRIPIEKEGSSIRLVMLETPNNEKQIETNKRTASIYAYNNSIGHWDFTFFKSNAFLQSALEQHEKEYYEGHLLGEFYKRNKESILAYANLCLNNNLLGGWIHAQISDLYSTYGQKGLNSLYIDDRVGFKGIRKFLQIRKELIKNNPIEGE